MSGPGSGLRRDGYWKMAKRDGGARDGNRHSKRRCCDHGGTNSAAGADGESDGAGKEGGSWRSSAATVRWIWQTALEVGVFIDDGGDRRRGVDGHRIYGGVGRPAGRSQEWRLL